MNCLISQYFLYVFYIVMQNGNLERRVEETVLSDKFPCRQGWIPTFVGMTAYRQVRGFRRHCGFGGGALFDDDFGEAAAEVFAFVGNAQGDLECGIGVDFGDAGVLVEQLCRRPSVHCFAHGQA